MSCGMGGGASISWIESEKLDYVGCHRVAGKGEGLPVRQAESIRYEKVVSTCSLLATSKMVERSRPSPP